MIPSDTSPRKQLHAGSPRKPAASSSLPSPRRGAWSTPEMAARCRGAASPSSPLALQNAAVLIGKGDQGESRCAARTPPRPGVGTHPGQQPARQVSPSWEEGEAAAGELRGAAANPWARRGAACRRCPDTAAEPPRAAPLAAGSR